MAAGCHCPKKAWLRFCYLNTRADPGATSLQNKLRSLAHVFNKLTLICTLSASFRSRCISSFLQGTQQTSPSGTFLISWSTQCKQTHSAQHTADGGQQITNEVSIRSVSVSRDLCFPTKTHVTCQPTHPGSLDRCSFLLLPEAYRTQHRLSK